MWAVLDQLSIQIGKVMSKLYISKPQRLSKQKTTSSSMYGPRLQNTVFMHVYKDAVIEL